MSIVLPRRNTTFLAPSKAFQDAKVKLGPLYYNSALVECPQNAVELSKLLQEWDDLDKQKFRVIEETRRAQRILLKSLQARYSATRIPSPSIVGRKASILSNTTSSSTIAGLGEPDIVDLKLPPPGFRYHANGEPKKLQTDEPLLYDDDDELEKDYDRSDSRIVKLDSSGRLCQKKRGLSQYGFNKYKGENVQHTHENDGSSQHTAIDGNGRTWGSSRGNWQTRRGSINDGSNHARQTVYHKNDTYIRAGCLSRNDSTLSRSSNTSSSNESISPRPSRDNVANSSSERTGNIKRPGTSRVTFVPSDSSIQSKDSIIDINVDYGKEIRRLESVIKEIVDDLRANQIDLYGSPSHSAGAKHQYLRAHSNVGPPCSSPPEPENYAHPNDRFAVQPGSTVFGKQGKTPIKRRAKCPSRSSCIACQFKLKHSKDDFLKLKQMLSKPVERRWMAAPHGKLVESSSLSQRGSMFIPSRSKIHGSTAHVTGSCKSTQYISPITAKSANTFSKKSNEMQKLHSPPLKKTAQIRVPAHNKSLPTNTTTVVLRDEHPVSNVHSTLKQNVRTIREKLASTAIVNYSNCPLNTASQSEKVDTDIRQQNTESNSKSNRRILSGALRKKSLAFEERSTSTSANRQNDTTHAVLNDSSHKIKSKVSRKTSSTESTDNVPLTCYSSDGKISRRSPNRKSSTRLASSVTIQNEPSVKYIPTESNQRCCMTDDTESYTVCDCVESRSQEMPSRTKSLPSPTQFSVTSLTQTRRPGSRSTPRLFGREAEVEIWKGIVEDEDRVCDARVKDFLRRLKEVNVKETKEKVSKY